MNPSFIGENDANHLMKSLEEIEVFTNYFVNLIDSSNELIICGHKRGDFDSLASIILVAEIAKFLKKEFKLIISPLNSTTEIAFNDLISNDIKENIITEEKAIKSWNNKKLLIILDNSNFSQSDASNLIDHIHNDRVIVIDHHKIGYEIKKIDSHNLLIDMHKSSTVEILIDILEQNKILNKLEIKSNVATLLLSGIYLDTWGFTRKISAKTFKILSMLRGKGADIEKINEMFKYSYDEFLDYINLLKNNKKLKNNIIISYGEENQILEDKIIAGSAETISQIKDVNAAFVVAKIKSNLVKVSARSFKNYNVQIICEKLNGGGHKHAAAATRKNISVADFVIELEATIKKTKFKDN